MSSKDVPEPWASRMVEKGFTDPRYNDDRPSMSRLAEHIDAHTSTVSAAIRGTRRTKSEVVVALAEALGDDVAGWLGVEYHGRWSPPPAASLLTDRQRKALEELINSMTERQEHADARRTPTIGAGVTPAFGPNHPSGAVASDDGISQQDVHTPGRASGGTPGQDGETSRDPEDGQEVAASGAPDVERPVRGREVSRDLDPGQVEEEAAGVSARGVPDQTQNSTGGGEVPKPIGTNGAEPSRYAKAAHPLTGAQSKGRQARRRQDEASEAPDESGPDEGA